MKKIGILFSIGAVLLLLFIAFNKDRDHLAWSDEFEDGSYPDTTKWTLITGNGCPGLCGFGNNELQYYTDDPENVQLKDGKLVIVARRDTVEGNHFTSAKLVSKDKGDWKYGRIEARAKMPSGKGTWSAIWMLPTLDRDLNWPKDGEIDIMEHVGYNYEWVYGTIHSERFNGMLGTQRGDSIHLPHATRKFHDYAVEWDPTGITWFVDGEKYHHLDRWDDWPFDKPFHLIVNLAVGGNWGGKHGLAAEIWPEYFEIDYIRVYKPEI